MTTDPLKTDVIVIGAGPAGVNAALAASASGLTVRLVDEAPRAGGQVWRAPPASFRVRDPDKLGPDYRAGEELRGRLAASDVLQSFEHRVWMIRPGFVLDAVGDGHNHRFTADALIMAPGTTERIIPFRGQTLPGVIGLGAATLLLKSQKMLPGRRTLVAGAGPLLAAVASSILKSGGEVAAIVDLNRPTDWMKAVPAMMRRPDLLKRGLEWMALIRMRGVPYLWGHGIRAAFGDDAGVQRVVVGPLDRNWRDTGGQEEEFAVDALTVGHGLSPATEMTRQLLAEQFRDHGTTSWRPKLDTFGRTTVPRAYVAGDGGGVAGVAAACLAGELAGLTAAHDLGRIDSSLFDRRTGGLLRRLSSARAFGSAMARLTTIRPGLVEAMSPDTVVCRCEDLTRAVLDDAFDAGACTIGQLKAWTRCGMGPCQGRMCGEAVVGLAAARNIAPEAFGQMVARAPLRPVPIGALTGETDYADIALPPSLPSH